MSIYDILGIIGILVGICGIYADLSINGGFCRFDVMVFVIGLCLISGGTYLLLFM